MEEEEESAPVTKPDCSICEECNRLLVMAKVYNMLEDVKRLAESARRMRQKLRGYSQFKLPFPLKNLRRAAASRSTKIHFLSSRMSRR